MDCPSCYRLLYSRTHKTCGYCGAELPAGVLSSEAELAAIKVVQDEVAARRAKVRAKEREEKEQMAKGGAAGVFLMPPFSGL